MSFMQTAIIIIVILGFSDLVRDYQHIKRCEDKGYSYTYIWKTKLICSVEVSK